MVQSPLHALREMLAHDSKFQTSAKSVFLRYDRDKDNKLNFREMRQVCLQ